MSLKAARSEVLAFMHQATVKVLGAYRRVSLRALKLENGLFDFGKIRDGFVTGYFFMIAPQK